MTRESVIMKKGERGKCQTKEELDEFSVVDLDPPELSVVGRVRELASSKARTLIVALDLCELRYLRD